MRVTLTNAEWRGLMRRQYIHERAGFWHANPYPPGLRPYNPIPPGSCLLMHEGKAIAWRSGEGLEQGDVVDVTIKFDGASRGMSFGYAEVKARVSFRPEDFRRAMEWGIPW